MATSDLVRADPTLRILIRHRVLTSIGKSLAIGLVFGLALLPSPSSALEPSTDHDVVIVGGGVSGLYAAYTLKNLGYDVLILEASNRHGGRLYSDTLGDMGIERGAEELYADSGENLNFVFDAIVAEYGAGAQIQMFTGLTYIEMDGGTVCSGGACGADADIYDYWDFYYDVEDHDNDGSDPLVSTYLESWGGSGGVDSMHRAFHLYEDGVAGTYGTTVEKLGLRSLSREINVFQLSGTVYGLAPTGYLDALNTLYFDTVVPSNILLNRPVVEIDTGGIKPVAIDSTGVHHYADAIIVTVSLGVLKADLIDFTPDHSVAKQNAIDTIGFGNGMKISLRFSSQFWNSNLTWLLMTGPLASCWDPGLYQPSSSDHVLTCFLMGRNSEVMEALPDDAARITQALDDLDVVFGSLPFASRPTQVYVEGAVQNWTAEPYILGSYSFPAPDTRPGANGSTTEREVLAQQVGTELYFAGEATHNTASSTVIGAMRMGERAAGEVDSDTGGPPSVSAPTANFVSDVTSGSATLNVTFTDTSSPSATGWSWDFGDTGTSSAQNPVHPYTTPGTYTVSLTSTNPNGSHTIVMPNLISVSAGAVCGNGALEAGEECDDSNTVGGDGCSATCDIEVCGNGVLDVGEACDDGNTVSGDGCSDLCVVEPAPTADFAADVTSGNAPLLVMFSDLSTDGPTSWLWDFGDMGAASTDENPVYNYTDAGTYTVSLTATNGSGFDTMVKTDYIVVPEPTALLHLGAGILLLIGLNNRHRRGDRGS